MKKIFTFMVLLSVLLTGCKQQKSVADATADEVQLVGPVFNADSALAYCAAQCDFGPRTMNSKAHDDCAEWIIKKFKEFGCEVQTQKADVKGWDGTMLRSTNIIASIDVPASASDTVPDNADAAKPHIVICAHWDSRPWADNDPDTTNWKKPVMAANDGASGVGVMLEMARIINENDEKVKVSFVCFDAEDYGAPDWSGLTDTEDTWALGAQHYAKNLNTLYKEGEQPVAAILLDMVGGQGARFYHEGLSMYYAESLVRDVWAAAAEAGFGSYFINRQGFSGVTDDHKPLNEAGLPAIDIISYYPDCEQSSFGPTWHTVNDDMNHLDKDVLKAVGQTLIQYLYR